MPMRSLIPSVRRLPRWALITSVLLGLTSLVVTGFVAGTALAKPAGGAAAQQASTYDTFDATGLPSGSVKGIPQHTALPPDFTLKHIHGGPSYVYVISGSLDIIEGDNSRVTYHAGDFFWEPVGHTHTVQTTERAEIFVLRFLTPGAEGTVEVQ
jgi:Cupin domain